MFCENGVLRNFAKFIGKHLRWSIFLIKLQASGKKETLTQVFSSEFCEISKNTFSYSVPPVAASVNLMIYSPKTLQSTIKLPFRGWECSFILLRPGWLYKLQKKSKSLKRQFCYSLGLNILNVNLYPFLTNFSRGLVFGHHANVYQMQKWYHLTLPSIHFELLSCSLS